jgi:hypothetical protein
MKKFIFLFMISISNVYALEAVVTVLETPILQERSYDAKVVQYLRKGETIKIHSSVANDRRMNQYAPSEEKFKKIQEKFKNSPDYKQDPLFRGEEENTFGLEDEFIPVVDRLGNISYVISKHIYVYFNDARENEQTILTKDPTDYRLEEPLPKNYPLPWVSGLRGQFLLGLTQPNFESYDYPNQVRTKGYSSPVDFHYTLLKQAPGKYEQRLFIGGTFGLRYYSNTYSFYDLRTSEEKGIKLGIGPTISYDAYKGEKNRINLSGTFIVNLFDRLYINQNLGSNIDNREYAGNSLLSRLAIQYHRKSIAEDLDFVLGTSLEIGSATIFRAKNAGKNPTWWQSRGDDKFTTRATFTLGGYAGLQVAY